jgi:hypothetical protein
MRKQDVRNLLYEGLAGSITAAGFRLRKRDEGFVRKLPEGRQLLSIALINAGEGFACTLTLGIRLDAVEELVNGILATPALYAGETLTTLTQLEYFGFEPILGRGVWFPVRSQDDVAGVITQWHASFETQLSPFFERYRDIASVAEGVLADLSPPDNGPEPRPGTSLAWLLRPFKRPQTEPTADVRWVEWKRERRLFNQMQHPYRALKNVAVAYLAGSNRLDRLVESYRRELAPLVDTEKQKFEDLLRTLQRSSQA